MLTQLTAGDRERLFAALQEQDDPDAHEEPDHALLSRARARYAALYDALGVTTPVSDWMLARDPDAEVPRGVGRRWGALELVVVAFVVGVLVGIVGTRLL